MSLEARAAPPFALKSFASSVRKYPENTTLNSLLRIADALDLNLGSTMKRAIATVEKEKS